MSDEIYIDGDFNDSYESSIQRSKAKRKSKPMKTETKEMEGETMLDKAITFRSTISNGNYSCVGIPYSDALKVVNQLRSELQKAKELNRELVEGLRKAIGDMCEVQTPMNQTDRQNRQHKMIKAKLNNGDLVFGLSNENIRRLKEGQPIAINLKDMGLEDRRIMITYGETEDDIFKEMLPYIDLDKTKVNL